MRWGVGFVCLGDLYVSFTHCFPALLYCLDGCLHLGCATHFWRDIQSSSYCWDWLASVVSGAIWTLQHRLALLPLCPWAGSWSTTVLCDQRGSSTYLAPCSSFIFTVGNEARLFILTIKGNLNDTFSPSASSLRLVYNEP